ncbi:succinylglutamate desuccinylase/aspartoacylase family protein [Costertonia aggregata]|uniref:Succinylglutamate desuccinylase/aspartoacylase family protein n=1 Tax=Costertonia aggregata TaxID=343403 RepID=A0A7H9ANB3_9FLAO|nr:succinylglutamate desuccinylase/aspartoacylase family protein [Costertonia aggregata]QLG44917.1 succinylglutamate desuccinylase/aspartoacylase family protein [Costertonia aggregata]
MAKLAFTILFVVTSFGVTAQNTFQEAFNSETGPYRKDIRITFTDSQNNRTFLPISIIKGKNKGPVFTIVAGVHGFEYPPIIAVQRLMQEIRPDNLTGTLIMIPIASTDSFYSREPFKNAQDKVNLNRVFPGRRDGSVTEKIADFITTEIIPVSDVFLDVHGGDAPEDLLPYICYYDNRNYPEQTEKAKTLSENSGFEYVVSYAYTLKDDEPSKYVFKQACQVGKVALSIESGKLGNVQEEAIIRIENGVYRMLEKMGMYELNIEKSKDKLIRLNNQKYIDADAQGIFYSAFKAGDKVEKGETVGYITDEFGKTISELQAPVSGVILYKIATPPVNIDDTIMCISFAE